MFFTMNKEEIIDFFKDTYYQIKSFSQNDIIAIEGDECVVALELWIIPVTTAPTKTPITTLLVRNPIIFFNCSPADFWSPSPIIFMPYKNNPNPPNKLIAICTFAPP